MKKKAYQATTTQPATAARNRSGPGTAAAVHDLLHAVLAAFQHLLEIRGLRAGALAPGTAAAFPAATAAASTAAATTLIAPRHGLKSLSFG